MNTAEIETSECIDTLMHLNSFTADYEDQELLLIPDNLAEILIPISGNIRVRIIGSARYGQLKPGAAYFLSPRRRGMEISLTHETVFLIAKVNPIYSKQIAEQLEEVFTGIYNCGRTDEIFPQLELTNSLRNKKVIAQWIDKSLVEGEAFNVNTTIEDSIQQIKSTSGAIRIKDLYTNLNISKSKLEKHFNKEIGMTPKEFCKIEKINHFIRSYKEGYSSNLTELTYQCGYYDQSHLIKDFKYLLNTSPRKFFTSGKAI